MFSTGRTTGIVVDSGDYITSASPVFEGQLIHHAVDKIYLAGRDLTTWMCKLLKENNYYLDTSAE